LAWLCQCNHCITLFADRQKVLYVQKTTLEGGAERAAFTAEYSVAIH